MRFWERIQQPCFDCFGIGTAIGGTAQAVGSVAAAEQQASAARDAAKISADATMHGADLQDAANQRAEIFNREQAEALWQNTETDRRANFDQWAAKQRYIGSLGTALGLGGRDIPAYVASVDPRFTASGPGVAAPHTPVGAAAINPSPHAVAPIINPMWGNATLGSIGHALSLSSPNDMRASVAGIDPRLMGGNGDIVAPIGTPRLQPDGTYAIDDSLPTRSIAAYLGA